MIGLLSLSIWGFLGFLWITIFYMPLICFVGEKKGNILARKTLRNFSKMLLRSTLAKVEVIYEDKESIDNINKNKGIVVVGNHESNLDIPLISGYFPIELGFVAKHEMEKWPFFGIWMKKSKCVFLNRENPREGIKSIRRAVEIIKEGNPIVVFPEGARTLDGKIQEFKKGSFKLATETNGIIIPIAVKGTYDIQRRGSLKVTLGRKVKLIIGKPIEVEKLNAEEKKKLVKTIKNNIEEKLKDY